MSKQLLSTKAAAVTVGVLAAVVLNLAPVLACAPVASQHRNDNSHTKTVKHDKHDNNSDKKSHDEYENKNHESGKSTQTHEQTTHQSKDDKHYLHRDNKPAGDNGTVKTHKTTTATTDIRDNPKVCAFYLDAFQFDGQQSVDWYIVQHTHGAKVLSGSITLDNGGHGYTSNYSLPNGMYKLYWNFEGEHGSAKHKVFKVSCGEVKGDETETPPCDHETPGTTNPETPQNPGGKGSDEGHILAAHTDTPAVVKGELVNTGTSPIVTSIIATVLLAAAAVVGFGRKARPQTNFNDIAL